MTKDYEAGHDGLSAPGEDVYVAAAKAYCEAKFEYAGYYVKSDGAARHLAADAADQASKAWLRAVVDVAYNAGREAERRVQETHEPGPAQKVTEDDAGPIGGIRG